MENLNKSIASKGVQYTFKIFLTKTQAQIIFRDKLYQLTIWEIQTIPKLLINVKSRALPDSFISLSISLEHKEVSLWG